MEQSQNRVEGTELKTDLIVALDFPRADNAFNFIEDLQGLPLVFKVGLELFMSGGPDLVRELVHRKHRVFLDLKMYDIPHQVAQAARQAAFLHVDFLTLHLSGGAQMVRQTAEALAEIPNLKPKLLGVSVLTSFDAQSWGEVTQAIAGRRSTPGDSVEYLVTQAAGWGLDGMVCSSAELPWIRKHYPRFYTVVPGVRPLGAALGDQKRVATPLEACQLGAHAIVVGRPIIESPEPRVVVTQILKDLCHSG